MIASSAAVSPALAPRPLLIGDALRWLGLEGGLVVLVVALLGFWHLRSGMQLLSQVGFVAKILGIVAIAAVAAAVGLIPGVTLEVATQTVMDTLGSVAGLGQQALDAVLEVVA